MRNLMLFVVFVGVVITGLFFLVTDLRKRS
jgi:hypothetical protein